MKYLNKINGPEDIKYLSVKELESLAQEIRSFIIENIHKTGGHLGSSLGVVELTLALHQVYNSPQDKIVWDVGHQGYPHKIITGRREQFMTNRCFKGLSGFIKPSESEHDAFGVGHASTSISAGYGMAIARDILKQNHDVVSVIGDGSMSGGLALEGLNNAGSSDRKMLIILNDNDMSISKNVGAISNYLTSLLTDPTFNKIKDEVWNFVSKVKYGKMIKKGVRNIENSIKTLVSPGILFEKFGFTYIGPVNGHDLNKLISTLKRIKYQVSGPVILHILTEKGKGFSPAENDITGSYHGVGPGILSNKEVENAENYKNDSSEEKSYQKYQDIFGDELLKIAKKDSSIVAVTAAMKTGTGLAKFSEIYPERFFDVGIAEGHAVTFAAGLSISGLKPVVAIYSTFLQRAYDHIIHDCALQNLDMIFAIDRAGLVGEDGPTHHGVFDISFLRSIPNLILMAPKDDLELREMLNYAASNKGLFAIRYPRGKAFPIKTLNTYSEVALGKGELLTQGTDIAILTVGSLVGNSLDAACKASELYNISTSVYNMRFIKPLDMDLIMEAYHKHSGIIIVEENSIKGGLGSAILEKLAEHQLFNKHITLHAIPDEFIEHGDMNSLYKLLKFDVDSLSVLIKNTFDKIKEINND